MWVSAALEYDEQFVLPERIFPYDAGNLWKSALVVTLRFVKRNLKW